VPYFPVVNSWWCGCLACRGRKLKWPSSGVYLYKRYR
jgi:hypothetical protein